MTEAWPRNWRVVSWVLTLSRFLRWAICFHFHDWSNSVQLDMNWFWEWNFRLYTSNLKQRRELPRKPRCLSNMQTLTFSKPRRRTISALSAVRWFFSICTRFNCSFSSVVITVASQVYLFTVSFQNHGRLSSHWISTWVWIMIYTHWSSN